MPLYGPRSGAAFEHRHTVAGLTGVGPMVPNVTAARRLATIRRDLFTERELAQLATAGAPRTYLVPWTARDTARLYSLRVVGANRGRGPKSYIVTGAGSYSPIPDAAPAPGGLTGALSRVVDRLRGRDTSSDSSGCVGCG